MKLCNNCERKVWPYLLVSFIAGFSAFLTWLTLGSAGVAPNHIFIWTASVFLGVFLMLSAYVTSCLRRHCDHHE
jgi:hypothetical protein